MSEPWDALATSIIDTIKVRASKFLDENAAAKDLIVDRAKVLAKLAWEYKLEGDEPEREEILHEMSVVKQTIENELSAMALVGKAESISTFKEIVGTALGAVLKYLPAILAAI